MFKKTITYEDYNGIERTEDFYFHLSKAELAEMELSKNGGMKEYLEKIIAAKDNEQIIKLFKGLVFKAYGEKSEDGRRFIKSEEISRAFSQTEAYSDLFMELATDTDSAIAFVNGIMPKGLDKEVTREDVESMLPQSVK